MGWFVIISLILGVFYVQQSRDIRSLKEDVQSHAAQSQFYRREMVNCQDSLEQANQNIESARGYAGSSYEEMNDALENLETEDL